jgi:CubicO group peptidase (beta-lactamase class C family)
MTKPYVPPPRGGAWRRAENGETGLDPTALRAAAAFALGHETPWARDLASVIGTGYFEPPPWNEIIGPVAPRGAPNGMVLHRGLIVAEWGDTSRVDMTFSVAKSYLGLLAGIAVDRGLIGDLDEPVGRRVEDGGFASPHNAEVTWRHLLQQTSEWEGTLWDKPDLVDRNRDVGVEGRGLKGTPRTLQAPGRYWEYNDVRVNRLSLALLRLFRRPLPDVFRDALMAPIGASADWQWHGYRNSFVEIDGERMPSVSGGGHWGGGVFIHAGDQARLGLLMLRRGLWDDRRLLAERWIDLSTTPCKLNPQYGFLWWLNTGRQRYPSAPADGFCAAGAGGNFTWIDPTNDLVAVLRWIDPAAMDGFLGILAAALPAGRAGDRTSRRR